MTDFKELESLLAREPFKPFDIETTGGSLIGVQSAGHMKLPPEGFATIIVFGPDKRLYMLEASAISSISQD